MIQLMNAPPSAWEHMPASELDVLLLIDNAVKKGQSDAK